MLFIISILIFSISFIPTTCRYLIDDTKGYQRIFDGIGGVSGGGATSKLLYSYLKNENERKPIMDILFNKDNGLQMLKVEMGGDDQSTEGAELSHESQYQQYYVNSYEFQLIYEARKINPTLPICVLPWTFPGWLGKTPYDNVTQTAKYVVDWLKIGRSIYNFDTYCVGVWNERNFSEIYVKELRRQMNMEGFEKTKIVAGEGYQMNDNYDRLIDKEFINEYDIIGVHYPGGMIPEKVQKTGKTIWASEDYSTDNRGTGEGCMARIVNWNYVDGNITGMLVWHIVSAFYPQIAWYRSGLSYLDEKEFKTEKAFNVLRMITGHVKPGWRILGNGNGSGRFEKGGTYVTYTNGKHMTIIVETTSYEKSLCEYSNPDRYYVSKKQKVIFELSGRFKYIDGLNISMNYEEPRYLKKKEGEGMKIEIWIEENTFGILTTLPINIPNIDTISIKQLSNIDYYDNFTDYKYGEEVRYWTPQKGSWIVENGIMKQNTIDIPISWCTGNIHTPYTIMNSRWNNYDNIQLSLSFMIPSYSNASSVIIGFRSNCSGCDIGVTNCRGIFIEISLADNTVTISTDFVKRTELIKIGTFKRVSFDIWHNFKLILNARQFRINFEPFINVKEYTIPDDYFAKVEQDKLFVIATGSFGESFWDDMSIIKLSS